MTLEFISFFATLHTLGTLIGTGFTTYAEAYYTRAAADDRISHHEKKYLRHLFDGLKFGMVLVIISGIALIVLEYLVPDAPQDVLAAPFWVLQTLTIVVITLGWMLSTDKTSWWFGSAAVLVAWWMMFLIDLGFLNAFGYIQLLIAYVLITFIVGALLGYMRTWIRRHTHSHKPT